MIKKIGRVRQSIFLLLVILFPLAQKQWLNLYLFNINNLSIYKVLYYLSGLIVPVLIIINSLNKFTYYNFNYHNKKNNNDISGRLLLLITFIVLTLLSILISYYIFINLKIILSFFLINNEYLVQFDFDKKIFSIVVISTLLIFKKTKFLLKKIALLNFFILSIITWYSQIHNSFLIDLAPLSIFKFGNIYIINIAFLLSIETVFYLWSYISFSSYLSDWKVPKPYKIEFSPILNIVIFYLLIIIYYSILLE